MLHSNLYTCVILPRDYSTYFQARSQVLRFRGQYFCSYMFKTHFSRNKTWGHWPRMLPSVASGLPTLSVFVPGGIKSHCCFAYALVRIAVCADVEWLQLIAFYNACTIFIRLQQKYFDICVVVAPFPALSGNSGGGDAPLLVYKAKAVIRTKMGRSASSLP